MSDGGPTNQDHRRKPPSWRQIVANFVDAYAEAQRAKASQKKSNDKAANWTAWATVAIAAFTFATICVGIAQWNIQSHTLDEIQVGDRAWLAPLSAELADPLSTSTSLVARVSFQNTGHQPTFGFGNSVRPIWVVAPKPLPVLHWADLSFWNDGRLNPNQLCRGVHPKSGAMVVFPNGASAIYAPPLNNKETVDAIKRGDTIFGVVGCFAYMALGQERHSSFCFYIQPVVGRSPDQWEFRGCPVGNSAT